MYLKLAITKQSKLTYNGKTRYCLYRIRRIKNHTLDSIHDTDVKTTDKKKTASLVVPSCVSLFAATDL